MCRSSVQYENRYHLLRTTGIPLEVWTLLISAYVEALKEKDCALRQVFPSTFSAKIFWACSELGAVCKLWYQVSNNVLVQNFEHAHLAHYTKVGIPQLRRLNLAKPVTAFTQPLQYTDNDTGTDLSFLTNLTTLEFPAPVNGTPIPVSLFTNLTKLSYKSSVFDIEQLRPLTRLVSLQHVTDYWDKDSASKIADIFTNFTSLEFLSAPAFPGLSKLTSITTLHTLRTYRAQPDCHSTETMGSTQVKQLRIVGHCRIHSDFSRFTQLQRLELHEVNNGTRLLDLASIPNLNSLEIIRCSGGINNDTISKLTNLTELSMVLDTNIVTGDAIQALTNLTHLDIRSDYFSESLLQYLPNLTWGNVAPRFQPY